MGGIHRERGVLLYWSNIEQGGGIGHAAHQFGDVAGDAHRLIEGQRVGDSGVT